MSLECELAQLEEAQLVQLLADEEQTYSFKHALVQEAAYQLLLKQDRRTLHRVVGETLEQLYAARLDEFAAVLAQHFAATGDDAKTMQYAVRAGDVAARTNAVIEAIRWYATALEALARLPDRQENRRQRLETLVKQVSISMLAELPVQNLERLDQAATLAQELSESDASAQAMLAQIYLMQGFANLVRNDHREALRLYQQSLALAQALHHDPLVAQVAFDIGFVLCLRGRFDEGERQFRENIPLFEMANKPLLDGNVLGWWGYALVARGFYAEGLRKAQQYLAASEASGNSGQLQSVHVILALIHYMAGDTQNMLASGQVTVRLAQESGNRGSVFSGSVLQAWAEILLGHVDAAVETLTKAKAILDEFQGQFVLADLLLVVEVEIAFKMGDAHRALSLAQQCATMAQAVDNLFVGGVAQRMWGQCLATAVAHDLAECEAHFAESLRMSQAGDARLESARTHVAWGRVLMQRANAQAAREHFETAAAQYEKSGLAQRLEEVRTLLDEVAI